MTPVRARTFCFCIPVRFGVFILSTLFLLGSAVIAAIGWYSAAHKEQSHLTKNQQVSVIIASVSYTILAVVSLFGLIGTITKRQAFVSMYCSIISWHLGFNIATGAYFIYTLFHQVGEDDVNNCIIDNIDNIFKSVQCMRAFEFVRGLVIGIFIAFWLFELWGCLIVAEYVSQLSEEDEPDYPPPAEITATVPPLATTYNYTSPPYSFSAPENSFGQKNEANV